MIAPDIASFLEEGIAILVGSRNERLEPNGTRAMAVSVEQGGTHLVVYVPDFAAPLILPDLEANGQGAVLFGRPVDDRSCQVKGIFAGCRPGRDDERELVERQWEAFLTNLGMIGISRQVFAHWSVWPVVAIRFRVTAVFEQSPGPDAGVAIA